MNETLFWTIIRSIYDYKANGEAESTFRCINNKKRKQYYDWNRSVFHLRGWKIATKNEFPEGHWLLRESFKHFLSNEEKLIKENEILAGTKETASSGWFYKLNDRIRIDNTCGRGEAVNGDNVLMEKWSNVFLIWINSE